ncbi:hypothetical protein EUX98_g3523 [Antrodiella citrinella]|uniref:Transmembrane protein n=1 Tax=Antrodiella citrinella TaxID=2447956 RepID=A0A4S4MWE2_9APHY|nr:hypothetical protein EUX98_g3523 [Antrodiella citrinella]
MTEWNSPATLALEGAAFLKLMHVLAGIFFWEFLVSFQFDLMFITGKKKFHWPLIFYFLNRYCLFFAFIGILIALDITTEVDCQSLYTFNQLFGDAAIGLASINLSLRTMAIWNMSLYIVVPLVLLILGHWSLILQGVLLKAVWVEGTGCVITKADNTVLAATFIYSMCLDLTVLVLSAVKLFSRRGSSQIVKLLFKDGLIFFMIAFFSNLLATTFMCLNLNAIMSIIFNVPAAVASTIVACRAVRRLNKYASQGAEVYAPQTRSRDVAFANSVPPPSGNFGVVTYPKMPADAAGIHVQMDTFTVTDHHLEHDDVELQKENRSRLHDSSSDVELALESKHPGL